MREIIARNVSTHVLRQRAEQQAFIDSLLGSLAGRGTTFHQIDQSAFRSRLPGV